MSIEPILWWPIVALIGAALVGFSLWTYRPGTDRRWILLSLRLLAALVIVAVMLRPTLIFTREQRLTSTLVFLVDKSESMNIKDEAANRSRSDAVRFDLENAKDALSALQERVHIRWFEFGSNVHEAPLDSIVASESSADRTSIGDSLNDVQRQLAGQRLAGVVLLTDGTNTLGNSPISIARQFRSQKVPIHAFGYGQEVVGQQSRDLIARNIRVSPTAFAKNRLPVTGDFDVSGFSGDRVDVKLLFNGVEQARGSFKTVEQARQLLAELQAIPLTPGDLKVTVEAAVDGDRQTANNSVSTWVSVRAGGISVLEIEGKYRYWEPKYLRWALDQSPDIELEQLFLLEQGSGRQQVPAELLEPGRYDVIVLGDVSAAHFDAESLEKLANLVIQRGVGLAMIGGYEAFGPGGWDNSPLAAILPVTTRRADPQRTEPVTMVPTEAGLRHFILRLAAEPDKNGAIWRTLRPLDGACTWTGLKPAAQILAEGTDRFPLLATQTVGAGRTLAFAGDTTWRWRRGEAGITYHARFWRQLILWLAKKEESGEANLKVTLPTRRLPVGQSLPITVAAEEANGTPIADATITATIELPTGEKSPVELFRDGDVFRGVFWKTEAVGDMTLEVTGKAGERDLGTQRTKFLTFSEDVEGQQPAADLATLRSVAEVTGGTFGHSLDLVQFLSQLEPADLNLSIPQPITIPLWDRWETLLVFLAIVSLEWVLRKRSGLT